MPYVKGQSGNLNGRKAGVPNKMTASAKEAFSMAFDKIGGAKSLAEWAEKNRTEFYKLFARLIPVDVSVNTPMRLVVEFKDDSKKNA